MCDNYDEWPPIHEWIRDIFPQLRNDEYQETSTQTCLYNCIAWAAEDVEHWWWPSEDSFWPLDTVDDESVQNFQQAFILSRAYEVCDGGNFEQGFEKVAIFAVGQRVKHMARQLDGGIWTSKLGTGWDITHHALEGVNCAVYGEPVSFLIRPRPAEIR